MVRRFASTKVHRTRDRRNGLEDAVERSPLTYAGCGLSAAEGLGMERLLIYVRLFCSRLNGTEEEEDDPHSG